MTKGRMRKRNKLVFSGLLVITLLAAVVAGCGDEVSRRTPSEGLNPFITDRVVTVHIVMKEEDWTTFTSELNQLAGPAKVEIFVG